MLSQDIDNAAASIDDIVSRNDGGSCHVRASLRGLQSVLRDAASQARQMEAQIAPGAIVAGRIIPVSPAARA